MNLDSTVHVDADADWSVRHEVLQTQSASVLAIDPRQKKKCACEDVFPVVRGGQCMKLLWPGLSNLRQ
jgi:hypothetical protein